MSCGPWDDSLKQKVKKNSFSAFSNSIWLVLLALLISNLQINLLSFFVHAQRAANTGWGPKDAKDSKWENDRFQGPTRNERGPGPSNHPAGHEKTRSRDRDSRDEDTRRSRPKKDEDLHGHGRKPTKYDPETSYREEGDRREEKRSKHDSESYRREDRESSRRTREREDRESDRRSSRHRG